MAPEELVSREEWREVVTRRLGAGAGAFDVVHSRERPLSDGGGFLGEHRLAEVSVRLPGEAAPRALRFFVKAEPRWSKRTDILELVRGFQKETGALGELFVALRAALRGGGADMQWGCECFLVRPDLIVLEDLGALGFGLVDYLTDLSFQHCAAVLRALANLHAASLICEAKHPSQPYCLAADHAETLRERFFTSEPDHIGRPWMDASVKTMCSLIREIRGEEFLARNERKVKEAMEELFELVKTSKRFRNVVCHGDLWKNNIFFRCENGVPVEARLVDYQIVRYTPPAIDVMDFLYLSAKKSLRDLHAPKLIRIYYDHLSKNLKRHDLDPEVVFPWGDFEKSCEFYKKLGVITTSIYSAVTLMNKDNYAHVFDSTDEYERFWKEDRTPEVLRAIKNDIGYKERVAEVIDEFFEVCEVK